jgi:general secretion pathway protein K
MPSSCFPPGRSPWRERFTPLRSVRARVPSSAGAPAPLFPHAGAGAGSGLIVVLWVVGLLSLLVGSFAFDAHIEARITSYYRKRTRAAYLASSGLEVARKLLSESRKIGKGYEKKPEDENDRWFDAKKRLADGQGIENWTETLGDGMLLRIDIQPEPARRNVNLLKDEDWERVFVVAGVPEDRWPSLIDSFNDWRDPDNVANVDGAETEDYYETLDPPYRAKNGPLDTVEELLLVKGFDRTLLFGGVIEPDVEAGEPIRISGMADLLTTYGDGKVNVNAATERVLRTLPEVDELVAGAIVEEREGVLDSESSRDTSFKNAADLMQRIPGLDPRIAAQVTTESHFFRVTATGDVQGVQRQVWCIVRFGRGELTVLRWREDE